MRVCVLTWGCQLNHHKSEEIAGVLAAAGYALVDRPEEADVVLLNTCMVRQKSEDKAVSRVRELRRLKRERPLLIGVGGCMAQGRGEKILEICKGADFAFGTVGLRFLPELIERARRGERLAHLPEPGELERLPVRRTSPFQAYVTLAEGCSHACAYCVIPRVRGPLRSRPMPEVLAELWELAERGYKEVTLLGQNVDAYGQDLRDGTSFARLLRAVGKIPIPRVRFTSSHPAYMTEEVIAAIAEEANICEHVHLAVQSGSDRILKAMRRGYTREGFLRLVERIKRAVPGVNLTTDVIVGFPGEEEEDFAATLSLIEEVRFGTVYVAAYSPRPNTPAEPLGDPVPQAEKARRLQEVLNLTRRIALELHRERLGSTVEILVEEHLPEKGLVLGKTRDFRTVLAPGGPELVGQFVEVEVQGATPAALLGAVKERVA
ncbi:MAG: tRNA (N6-isopentenyl adenosine(37)-C2)-methylthiotransferase MiaB [Candidatus Bipolaricaulota bacterium]|nr:tRNA (N6-isopentenyl adenosine(37)-C2)-methylthiotransferase MiaB [Candidatus Bipolaricaulota bacterium]MCX7844266.1 tRNA (N6-isopentenyl adenosine(37)-C2)-methylthiotransferase MiaB [Candidatus Bipolaricaulota bacterium]MDW8151886.1 tRNA (N6-isopentenyl adenosine(37)-C2)-methylthiotransferase MiaB [Candidatus Bipolaricaulota bacterium]